MSRISYIFVILVSLNGWCAAKLQMKLDLSTLPDVTPITELPPGIPTCKGSELSVNECIKNGLEEVKGRLKDGIPELSIPPLDPFVIEKYKLEIIDDLGGGHLNVNDLVIHGISETVAENVNLEVDGNHVKFQLSSKSPSIQAQGNLRGELTVEGMKLEPDGDFSGTLTDLVLAIEVEGDLLERDGHKYLKVTTFNFEPNIEDLSLEGDKIVQDETLNTVILDFINENWSSVYQIILKESRETWEPIVVEIANKYLDAVPFDLFIDTP